MVKQGVFFTHHFTLTCVHCSRFAWSWCDDSATWLLACSWFGADSLASQCRNPWQLGEHTCKIYAHNYQFLVYSLKSLFPRMYISEFQWGNIFLVPKALPEHISKALNETGTKAPFRACSRVCCNPWKVSCTILFEWWTENCWRISYFGTSISP